MGDRKILDGQRKRHFHKRKETYIYGSHTSMIIALEITTFINNLQTRSVVSSVHGGLETSSVILLYMFPKDSIFTFKQNLASSLYRCVIHHKKIKYNMKKTRPSVLTFWELSKLSVYRNGALKSESTKFVSISCNTFSTIRLKLSYFIQSKRCFNLQKKALQYNSLIFFISKFVMLKNTSFCCAFVL